MSISSLFSAVFNWPLVGGILLLIGLVLLFAYLSEKNKRDRTAKPGRQLHFIVPGKSAAACREALQKTSEQDLFLYTLEATAQGGWYFQLKEHRPTGQVLDTLYLLTFDADDPAKICLRFVREAFGQKEPIVPAESLCTFFSEKLGAHASNE